MFCLYIGLPQGLFQLFWEKTPGLNWEKICGILGYFGKFFRSVNSKKKPLKHVHDHDDFIHVYMKS